MNSDTLRCVLLADRNDHLREGMRGLLEAAFDAVVMVADETSLLETADRLQPLVVIVDLALSRQEGLRPIVRLKRSHPHLKVIVLSVYDEAPACQAALAAGAQGFVLKRTLATDLLAAVDAVLAGQAFVSAGVRGFEGRADQYPASRSPREF